MRTAHQPTVFAKKMHEIENILDRNGEGALVSIIHGSMDAIVIADADARCGQGLIVLLPLYHPDINE